MTMHVNNRVAYFSNSELNTAVSLNFVGTKFRGFTLNGCFEGIYNNNNNNNNNNNKLNLNSWILNFRKK